MKDVAIEESDNENYFIRLLTANMNRVPVAAMRSALGSARLPFKLIVEAGTDAEWEQLILEHRRGGPIAVIERVPVTGEGVGAEMIAAFKASLKVSKPVSGAQWVGSFLPRTKVIYSFEVLDAAEEENGWDGLYVLQTMLQEALGGIFQSDGEGFSNEQGAHIVWQFDDDVEGPWKMAVLIDGKWQPFMMELGNMTARKAFWEGKVPGKGPQFTSRGTKR